MLQIFENWSGGDIAQWNPAGVVKFAPATQNEFEVADEIFSLDAAHASGNFTAGHTIPLFNSSSRSFATTKAREAAARCITHLPISGFLQDDGEITRSQLRILVAVQADGHWCDENHPGALIFTLRKRRKLDRLKELLGDVNIPFTVQEFPSTPGQFRVTIRRKDVPKWLTPDRKVFGSWLLNTTKEAREDFLKEIFLWDGYNHPTNPEYCSGVKENAEWVATIAHLCGSAVTLKVRPAKGTRAEIYRCTTRGKARHKETGVAYTQFGKAAWKSSQFSGKVFCPTTETGFWIYRHAGKIGVTGNTGRDSAAGGFNPLNLPKNPFYFDADHRLISDKKRLLEIQKAKKKGQSLDYVAYAIDLRNVITAPKGKVLIPVDAAQIEARVTLGLSGDKSQLARIRDGLGVYEAHARDTMGYSDPAPLKDKDPLGYHLAKTRVLGCGFACGWFKFVNFAKGMLPIEAFEGIFGAAVAQAHIDALLQSIAKRTDDQAKEIRAMLPEIDAQTMRYWVNAWLQVSDFRKRNPKIVATWGRLKSAMALNDKKDFEIELPSGRHLRYRAVRVMKDSLSSLTPRLGKMMRVFTHGGKLLENCAQGAARDIFMDRVMEMRRQGHEVILRVYDEAVVLADEAGAEETRKKLEAIMSTSPSWWKSLPLGAEGNVVTRYTK